MTATVQIYEYNGSSQTESTNVSSLDLLSSDVSGGSAKDNPITQSRAATVYSYPKYIKLVVTNMGSASSLSAFKFWAVSADRNQQDLLRTNCGESGNYNSVSYTTPSDASAVTDVDNDVPSTAPTTENVGIGGSLGGSITDLSVNDRTDFIVIQKHIHVTTNTVSAPFTLYFSWTES